MIQQSRIQVLKDGKSRHGDYVLYWMQASQRSEVNHALEFAIQLANEMNLPVVAYFGLTDQFPEANLRHYYFMLQGLNEVQASLKERRIRLVIRYESPEIGAEIMARRAAMAVCDCGYLKVQRQWRRYLAENANCPVFQVESDCIVPVAVTSTKEEYSAATIRSKIISHLPQYLVRLEQADPKISSLGIEMEGIDISDIGNTLSKLDIDKSVGSLGGFRGGLTEARNRLHQFVGEKLSDYAERKNDPNAGVLSNLSPYLHFGQISPLEIALAVDQADGPSRDTYLDELIVRRELAVNFVYYNSNYDSFEGLPEWSRKTLREHTSDIREYVYSREELEMARTHDKYWNAAQKEMIVSGKMQGYMRMYWGKKILEWTSTPEEAFRIALYLNNKYELDGRDPNGYAGVAWCFGKHDRPWVSRPVFGNIRFMNDNGLRRKFDADQYAARFR